MFNNYMYCVIRVYIMLVEKRTLRSIGDSRYLAMPPDWLRSNRIGKDASVTVIVGEVITVLPARDYTSDKIDQIFAKAATVAKAVL